MGQHGRAGGSRYLIPLLSDDGTTPDQKRPGMYTLAANKIYYYILGGVGAPFTSVQITGYTAGAVIDAANIQDCNQGGGGLNEDGTINTREVSDISTTAGEWIDEKPSSGYVAVNGTGWSVGTGATACVVAAAGTAVGGAMFHVGETGAARTRLMIDTGGTGGDFVVAGHLKD